MTSETLNLTGTLTGGPYTMPSLYAVARTEGSHPSSFRVAQYPDGSKRIQGAYLWTQGFEGGHNWRDLPVVIVDESGQEIAPVTFEGRL